MASPLSNAELQSKVEEIERLLDNIIKALNNTVSTTTLNAMVLGTETRLDDAEGSITSLSNSVTTLQNIVVNAP